MDHNFKWIIVLLLGLLDDIIYNNSHFFLTKYLKGNLNAMSSLSLLQPLKLGDLTLKNRVVLAPLSRGRCGKDEVPAEVNELYYVQRVSAGLVITEATHISKQGTGWAGAASCYNNDHIKGWRAVTNAIHNNGGIIFMQMWHMGRVTHSSFHGLQPLR